jgi:phosphoglycolate phosphatase-like HAD superfamily hydrolase
VTLRYGHVVLDWDGTLVDSLSAKAKSAAEILARALGVAAATAEASYLLHSGVPRRVLFDRIAADLVGRPLGDAEFATLSAEFTARNLARIAAAPLQPGAAAAVRSLHDRGVRLAISSSAPEEDLDPRVASSGLRPLLDLVLATRPGFAKGPDHVAFLCARWAIEPARLLVVGDEAADVALARSAGAACALVLHTLSRSRAEAARPDHVLVAFDALVDLCAGSP